MLINYFPFLKMLYLAHMKKSWYILAFFFFIPMPLWFGLTAFHIMPKQWDVLGIYVAGIVGYIIPIWLIRYRIGKQMYNLFKDNSSPKSSKESPVRRIIPVVFIAVLLIDIALKNTLITAIQAWLLIGAIIVLAFGYYGAQTQKRY